MAEMHRATRVMQPFRSNPRVSHIYRRYTVVARFDVFQRSLSESKLAVFCDRFIFRGSRILRESVT